MLITGFTPTDFTYGTSVTINITGTGLSANVAFFLNETVLSVSWCPNNGTGTLQNNGSINYTATPTRNLGGGLGTENGDLQIIGFDGTINQSNPFDQPVTYSPPLVKPRD